MEETRTKTTLEKVKRVEVNCNICGKLIIGTKDSQVLYKLGLHKDAHKRKDEKKVR